MIHRLRAVAFLSLVGLAWAASGADFKHENKPHNLQAFFELVHHTMPSDQANAQQFSSYNFFSNYRT